MQTLINLITKKGEVVWVNPNYIATMTYLEDGTGAAVFIANDTTPLLVREMPEDIIRKMSVLR